jgi:uncharacterized membrane protein YphA (DoxX/SURF4 family)
MSVATATATVLLATLMVYAAARKLSHRPDVVATYERVGVPEGRLNVLAATLIAGAAGLLLGLLWRPIGLAAAVATVVYFLVAIAAHIRSRDLANLTTPIVMELLAAGAAVLFLLQ